MNTSSLGKVALGFILGLGLISTSHVFNGDYGYFNSAWPAIPGILIATYFIIVAQAEHHYNKIKYNIRPNHTLAALLRIGVSFAIGSLFYAYSYSIIKVIELTIINLYYWSIVFNYHLNRMRDLPIFYLGKDKKTAIIDRLFNTFKWGGEFLVVFDLIGILIFTYVYLKH